MNYLARIAAQMAIASIFLTISFPSQADTRTTFRPTDHFRISGVVNLSNMQGDEDYRVWCVLGAYRISFPGCDPVDPIRTVACPNYWQYNAGVVGWTESGYGRHHFHSGNEGYTGPLDPVDGQQSWRLERHSPVMTYPSDSREAELADTRVTCRIVRFEQIILTNGATISGSRDLEEFGLVRATLEIVEDPHPQHNNSGSAWFISHDPESSQGNTQ